MPDQTYDDRKRRASRSPEGNTKPLSKHSKPQDGRSYAERFSATSRQSSPTSRDPRLRVNPASSAAASRQQPIPSSDGIYNDVPTAPSGNSSSAGSPVKHQITTSKPSEAEERLTRIFSDLFNQLATVVPLRMSHEQAKAQLARFNREFQSMTPQFNTFPAIKEQATGAKTRAAKSVEMYQTEVEKDSSKPEKFAKDLAWGIVKPLKAMLQAEFVSREEHNDLRSRYDALDSAFRDHLKESRTQSDKLRDLTQQSDYRNKQLNGDIDACNERVRNLTCREEKLHNAISKNEDSVEKLSSKIGFVRSTVVEECRLEVTIAGEVASKRMQSIESQGATLNQELQKIRDETTSRNSIVEKCESGIQNTRDNISEQIAWFRKRIEANDQELQRTRNESLSASEIDHLRTKVISMNATMDNLQNTNGPTPRLAQLQKELDGFKQSVQSELALSAGRLDEFDRRIEWLDEQLGKNHDELDKLLNRELHSFSGKIDGLRADVEKVQIAQNEINKTLTLAGIKPGSKSPNHKPRQLSSDIKRTNEDIIKAQAPISSPGKAAANGQAKTTLDRSTDQVTLVGNGSLTGSGEARTAVSKVNDQIRYLEFTCDMLQTGLQQLTDRFNYLKTDELTRQMVNQLNQMCPNTENFQAAVTDLQKRIDELDGKITVTRNVRDNSNEFNIVSQSLDTFMNRITALERCKEVLSGDVATTMSTLERRVDGHQTLVQQGEAALDKIKTNVEALEKDIQRTKEENAMGLGRIEALEKNMMKD